VVRAASSQVRSALCATPARSARQHRVKFGSIVFAFIAEDVVVIIECV
jgi:hypothetical protein